MSSFAQVIGRAVKVSFLGASSLVVVWVVLYPVLLALGAMSGSPLEIPLGDILGLLPVMFGGLFALIFLFIVVPQLLAKLGAKK